MQTRAISRKNKQFGVSGELLFRSVFAAVAIAVGANTALAAPPAKQDPNTAPPALAQHLAAGEFALARQLADAAANPAARDAQLGLIAAAQSRAGGREAALQSASLMNGDLARTESLRDVNQGTADYLADHSGAAGGGAQADFASLMNLIESTIEPDSWEGGGGAMQPFRGGVYVDTDRVLRQSVEEDASGWLDRLHRESASATRDAGQTDVRRTSPLRKISLPRLERMVQLHRAAGRPLDEEMVLLAGLERIEYVLIYPETGDLVIAGPAGDWQMNPQGRLVNAASGHPVVRLDDLVTVWRLMTATPGATFGCTINPRQQALAATKAYLEQSTKRPLKAGGRQAWLKNIQQTLGHQDIEVFDLDPRTPVARVLIEADYHMKLIGMGLVEGTTKVPSYLDLIHVPAGKSPPPLDVLRWWFTLNYDAIQSAPGRGVFHIRGQGVQVQSENELLTDQGQRIQTGQSDELNREFARNFTEHFGDLAAKYPVYAELQNVFDLALTGALVASERLADQVAWHQTCFGPNGDYQVPMAAPPAAVDTVINHRVVNGKHIVAGVSGGVHVAPVGLVRKSAIRIDQTGSLESERARGTPAAEFSRDVWWWD